MKLSIIYVYYNTPEEIVDSINSIKNAVGRNSYEVIVVDNKSQRRLPKSVSKNPLVNILVNIKNEGYGAGCNLGAKHARGDFLLFLNPDTILTSNSINTMVAGFTKDRKVGIVGPRMNDKYGKILPTMNSFLSFPGNIAVYSLINKIFPKNSASNKFWLYEVDRSKKQSVDVVSGACIMIKKEIFEKLHGFDERFFMYFEEQDLCLRVKKLGFKIIFNPKAEITHFVGTSLSDKKTIQKYFQKSRYIYFKKYFGTKNALFSELVIRSLTVVNLCVASIALLSLFLNLYNQNSLMLLIGDAGRDFLAARDMVITGKIPVVGIPSSVVWLHQGPTSVWLIGLSFYFSHFNPVAPAILFGLLGVITTIMVFYLGKLMFNNKVGVISSLLFSTAPVIVVNARMPYHTSLIPFFTMIFFIVLFMTIKNKKIFPILCFCLGLLLLVELSNIVVVGIVFLLFYYLKIKLSTKQLFFGFLSFCMGIIPFIIYEFQNGITYLKFPLWILNRIRLLFVHGGNGQEKELLNVTIGTMYQLITAAILPNLSALSLGLFIISLIIITRRIGRKGVKISHTILFLWIVFPLSAFLLHSAPGQAYFTLIYPAITILVGYFIYRVSHYGKILVVFFTLAIVLVNVVGLIKNQFYVLTPGGYHLMPPMGYSFGNSWVLSDHAAKAIVKDANGIKFTIVPGGIFKMYQTSLDPFIFLVWKHGGLYTNSSDLKYLITDKIIVPKNAIKIYNDNFENVYRI